MKVRVRDDLQKLDPLGRNSFSHSAARSYCAQRGMRIVSLDSRDKAEHFMRQVNAWT